MSQVFADTNVVCRTAKCSSCQVDDETVLMSPETGFYYELTPVASKIWELLSAPISIRKMLDLLLDEYEVDEEQCRGETTEFLTELAKEGLIETR